MKKYQETGFIVYASWNMKTIRFRGANRGSFVQVEDVFSNFQGNNSVHRVAEALDSPYSTVKI